MSIGKTIISTARYELIRRLGVGGSSEVFLAHRLADPSAPKQLVAIKILKQNPLHGVENILFNEAKAYLQIRNPHVIQLLGVERFSDSSFGLVIEYVEGINLGQLRLSTNAGEREALFFTLAEQLLKGLAAAHGAEVIHGDLTPKNILVDLKGVAKVGDFGLSCASMENNLRRQWGTPGYLSVHRMETGEISKDDDLFGLGAVLFEWVNGINIFSADLRRKLEETKIFHQNPLVHDLLQKLLRPSMEVVSADKLLVQFSHAFNGSRRIPLLRLVASKALEGNRLAKTATCFQAPRTFHNEGFFSKRIVPILVVMLVSIAPVLPAQQATWQSARPASLEINAFPWAEVLIDGVSRGATPVSAERLAPGLHQIYLRFENRTERFSILLYPGIHIKVNRGAPQQDSKSLLRRFFRSRSFRNTRHVARKHPAVAIKR